MHNILTAMSSKSKQSLDSKGGKGSGQSRKNNRRRSTRHASVSNGDIDEGKERSNKRGRDPKEISEYDEFSQDVYKSVIDLVPSTEYDCSPAENPATPGTRVNLHGVILHETQGGLIVLNVRWRNQVFSGALIDVEKTKWAAQRIPTDCSPDGSKFQPPQPPVNNQPPIKKIKIPTSALNQLAEDSDSGTRKKTGTTSPTTPSKSKSSRANGKKRNNTEALSPTPSSVEEIPQVKKTKIKIIQNGGDTTFDCTEPNCGKKYKNKSGLLNHRRSVHSKKQESFDEKEGKSDDSDSGDDNFVIDEKVEDEEEEETQADVGSAVKDGEPSSVDADEKAEANLKPASNGGEHVKTEADPKSGGEIPEPRTNAVGAMSVKEESTVKEEEENIASEQDQTSRVSEQKPPVGQLPPKSEPGQVTVPVDVKPTLETSQQQQQQQSVERSETKVSSPQTMLPVAMTSQGSGQTVRVEALPAAVPPVVMSSEVKSPPQISSVVKSEEDRQPIKPVPIMPPQAQHQQQYHQLQQQQQQKLPLAPAPQLLPPQPKQPEPPRGSSQIIIHRDHVNSLNELFVPTQNFQQFSPLSSLNPQKINESLTDALTKQTTVVSAAPIVVTKLENSGIAKAALTQKPSVEQHLLNSRQPYDLLNKASKVMYSELFKHVESIRTKMEDVAECSDEERSVSPENSLTAVHKVYPQERDLKTKPVFRTPAAVAVAQNPAALMGALGSMKSFENTLLFKELASKVTSEAANINQLPNNKLNPWMLPPGIDQKHVLKLLETEKGILPTTVGAPGLATVATSAIPVDGKLHGNFILDPASASTSSTPVEDKTKPSLLTQRLLQSHDVPTAGGATISPGKFFVGNKPGLTGLPTSMAHTRLPMPPIQQQVPKHDLVAAAPSSNPEFRPPPSDKITVVTSMTLNSNRPTDKTKMAAVGGSLRINPPASSEDNPPMTSTSSWIQQQQQQQQHSGIDVPKEGGNPSSKEYFIPPSSNSSTSPYRIPYSKSLSVGADLQIYPASSAGGDAVAGKYQGKVLMKRATSTIAIAPAPNSLSTTRPEMSPHVEYSINEAGGERFMQHRFTLSDKGLVSSPTENRGRPKKIRVEKTQSIPIGTAQEMARSRGACDSPVPRKATSPVVRASVIQGSLHQGNPVPANEHLPPAKPGSDRKQDIHMYQLSRSIDHPSETQPSVTSGGILPEERMRFHQQPLPQQTPAAQPSAPQPGSLKPVGDPSRNPSVPEKYRDRDKRIKSPPSGMPSMYYSSQPPQNPRRILSPPTSRSAISPRSSADPLQRSPTGAFPHELVGGPKPSYMSFAAEHSRNIHEIRKQEVARASENARLSELSAGRKSILSPSSSPSVPPGFRNPLEIDKDRAASEFMAFSRHQPPPRSDISPRDITPRLMYEDSDRIRERFMHAPGRSQPNMFTSGRTSSPPPPAHSSNLVLGRADGSILGKIPNNYDARTTDTKR